MNVPADTRTTPRPFPWLPALILFLFLYIVPSWPALIHAWWYSDDLCALEQGWRTLVPHCLENGRPVQSLWYVLFLFEQGPGASAVNCGMRFVQVGLHVAAAICIVRVIWQQVPSWAAFAGVLPFLLWGFSPEAVLWRGAGMYALAACLAAAGLLLIRLQAVRGGWSLFIAGCGLTFLAPLTAHGAAFFGLAAWAIPVALTMLGSARVPVRRLAVEGAALCLSLLCGCVVSLVIARAFASTHAYFTTSVAEKLAYLLDLNRYLMFEPHYYPRFLRLMTAVLLLLTVAAALGWAWASYRKLDRTWVRLGVVLACLGSLFVVPLSAVLLVRETWPAWRILYTSSLLLGGFWIVSYVLLGRFRAGRIVLAIVMVAIVAPHVRLLHIESKSRVVVFDEDLRTLAALEQYARDRSLQKVIVVTYPDCGVATWNPYRLPYDHYQSHASNLQIEWSAHAFVRRFSGLVSVTDEATRASAIAECRRLPSDGTFRFRQLPDSDVICVCPP